MDSSKRLAVWNHAIRIIDSSELAVRDVIERDLANIAGISGIRYGEAMAATDAVMKKIIVIRTKAFKKAFKLLRDTLS